MLNRAQQQGFVLVSVLLITSVSTFVALSSIGENRLQERIAGNQVKEVNARAVAEKGIFVGYQFIQAQQAMAIPIVDIISAVNTQSKDGYLLSAVDGVLEGTLLVTSQGSHQGATAYLEALITVGVASGNGEYNSAVVGCEGVVMSAGGVVDSFDSREGTYEKQFKDKYGKEYAPSTASAPGNPDEYINAKANVSTTYDTANGTKGDITQTGKAPIYGNINATGNYFGNGSKVGGDIKTNGNVNFTTKEAIKAGSGFVVSGDIYAGGDLSANFNPVKQNAFVAGDASNTINIDGNVKHKGSITGDYNESRSSTDSTIKNVNVQVDVCDSNNLAAERLTVSALGHTSVVGNGDFKSSDWQTQGSPFNFTPLKADYYNSGYKENDPNNPLMLQSDAVEIIHGGETHFAHVYEQFNLKGRDIRISGDVYIVVKKKFDMATANINIEKGSSLTMIVAGKAKMLTDTKVIEIPSTSVKTSSKSPMTLLSLKETEGNAVAVDIQGTNLSMTVDAPLGKVKVNAGGSFKGAIKGKTVDVEGAGSIHYDEKLGSGSTPTGGTGDGVKFAAIYYHYPN